MKTHLNLSVDGELIESAKLAGIKLSALIEESIRKELKLQNVVEADKLIGYLSGLVHNAETVLSRLNVRKAELDVIEKNRIDLLFTRTEAIPEAMNLSAEQLDDSKFMLNLVDLIRKKYDVKLGVAGIREYYELKAALASAANTVVQKPEASA